MREGGERAGGGAGGRGTHHVAGEEVEGLGDLAGDEAAAGEALELAGGRGGEPQRPEPDARGVPAALRLLLRRPGGGCGRGPGFGRRGPGEAPGRGAGPGVPTSQIALIARDVHERRATSAHGRRATTSRWTSRGKWSSQDAGPACGPGGPWSIAPGALGVGTRPSADGSSGPGSRASRNPAGLGLGRPAPAGSRTDGSGHDRIGSLTRRARRQARLSWRTCPPRGMRGPEPLDRRGFDSSSPGSPSRAVPRGRMTGRFPSLAGTPRGTSLLPVERRCRDPISPPRLSSQHNDLFKGFRSSE